ncbi:o-succinylbenzoate--CoA ligase [Candidatus Uabimicrobium amorphum]|uniref:2-succinylbenzoate-CoA ligase n=1 Tax=Uabimicrobium amorphum TaxID=2596890 RepID=A0A5S9IJB0_UABAM|nr:o-succinylbenzoate--CoA ligase [Candidatus Uabimicrobium amorphum]BBM82587.1 2-succinylbenzoate-CoA ligase [Candidatus Uabimicrobium amorphum]
MKFLVDQHAHHHPTNIALIGDNEQFSYEKLAQITTGIAQFFQQQGVTGRVAMVLPLDIDYVILFLALLRLEVLIVPINTRFPDEKIQEILDEHHCQYVICDRERHLSVDNIFYREDFSLRDFAQTPFSLQEIDAEKPSTVVFTSGSTGKSKGAVHTFANHYYSALGSNEHIPISPENRWLLSLPIYHVAGIAIVFRCLTAGATIVCSQKDMATAITDHSISHISLVTTQLQRLIDNNHDLSTLEHILVGGSAVGASLVQKAIDYGLNIYTSYGSTEMSSQIATTTRLSASCDNDRFRPLRYRDLKISTEGEILVKGHTLFRGYLQGSQVVGVTDEKGWYHTGDYGAVKEGYLRVYGRKDHMFISGGENIHPQEIEKELYTLSQVKNAIVVAIPHAEFGFRPVAFVDTTLTAQQLKQYLQKRLASFKIPDHFLEWPQHVPMKGIKPDRNYFVKEAHTQWGIS